MADALEGWRIFTFDLALQCQSLSRAELFPPKSSMACSPNEGRAWDCHTRELF